MDDHKRLARLVAGDEWFMGVLAAVRSIELPNWVVGSGAVRNLVWDALHGYEEKTAPADVDVAYFDPSDVSRERDARIDSLLGELRPDVPWETTNQAGVHLWYERKFGHPIEPLTSIEDALATWPETATCVGVRLLADDTVEVVAPLGLDDLFALVARRNPREATRELFRERIISKRIAQRWPKVTILDG